MCLIDLFFLFCRFKLITKHVIEFNQLAIANAEGSENILNRVMTKDNIGLCALLETKEDIWDNGKLICHVTSWCLFEVFILEVWWSLGLAGCGIVHCSQFYNVTTNVLITST